MHSNGKIFPWSAFLFKFKGKLIKIYQDGVKIMKGMILDYTGNDAFILLEDDSIITIPLTSFETLIPLGTNISLTNLFNKSTNTNYKAIQNINKTVDFL